MLHIYLKASRNNNTIYSSNYSLKMSSETLNCWTQLFLRYFDPSFNLRHFQRLHSCVWWKTGLSFQHGPNTKVHWVEIWRWRRPKFLALIPQKIVFAPSFGFLDVWEAAPSFWKLKSSYHARKGPISSIYTFVLTLAPCLTKIRGYFQVLDTEVQTMTYTGCDKQLQVFRNVLGVLGKHYVVLWI